MNVVNKIASIPKTIAGANMRENSRRYEANSNAKKEHALG